MPAKMGNEHSKTRGQATAGRDAAVRAFVAQLLCVRAFVAQQTERRVGFAANPHDTDQQTEQRVADQVAAWRASPAFAADPHAFVGRLRQARGHTQEFRVVHDTALARLEREVPPHHDPCRVVGF